MNNIFCNNPLNHVLEIISTVNNVKKPLYKITSYFSRTANFNNHNNLCIHKPDITSIEKKKVYSDALPKNTVITITKIIKITIASTPKKKQKKVTR